LSPSNASPYAFLKCAGFTAVPTASATSSGRRPDVLEVHGRAAPVRAERLGREVLVHLARERVRDDERGRSEVVHLDLRVDAPLEVAVAREDARDDEVACAHASDTASGSGPELPMHVVQP